ncbi:MAG: BrnA antitoxin family protein [Methylococcales bacterium]
MAKKDMKTYTLEEINALKECGDFVPTPGDAPEYEIDEAFWNSVRVVMPGTGKTHTGLRIDTDVLEWFRAAGKGYQSRMNAILRSYHEAHKNDPSRQP